MYIQNPYIKPGSIEKRDYQVNIANSCKEQSTLVVLPTGMGKTICALLVIAERLEKFPEKKILFMAPTKPLVEQHKAFIKEFLLVDQEKTTIFTGEVNPKKRALQWDKSQVIVSTPQVIENDLLSERLSLKDVSLIIFDESHRAVGNYAYVFVAEKYNEQGSDMLVMGITASPGSNAKKIEEVCNNLYISSAEIRSEYDPDVVPYVHDINVTWVRVEVPEKVKIIIKNLRKILEDKCKALYKFGLIRRFRNVSTTELLEAQRRIQSRMGTGSKKPHSLFYAATVQAAAIKINHAIELAETQGPSALRNYLDRLEYQANSKGGSKAAKSLLKDKNLQRVIKLADNIEFEHPKLQKIAAVVQQQLGIKSDSRIIVFTHYRDTSELVVKELSNLRFARPVRFVGQASHGDDRGLSQREQVALIEKFKEGEFNVLVATSVAEEGLDIPATDMVVFYEPIPSDIRTIQRRGRTGRKRPGKVIIMITKNTRDEAYYWSSRSKEKKMKHELEILRSKLADKFTVGIPKGPLDYTVEITPKKIKNNLLPSLLNDHSLLHTENNVRKKNSYISNSYQMDNVESIGSEINQIPNDQNLEVVESKSINNSPRLDEPISRITDVETNPETRSMNKPNSPPIKIEDNGYREDSLEFNSNKTDGQTSLGDFQSRMKTQVGIEDNGLTKSNSELKIIVDHREFKSIVVRELVKLDVSIEPKQLPIGDYIISERICIERKLVKDFLQSLIDGRLFNQLKNIKSEYLRPIMILEGEGLLTSRRINSSAIFGALGSIISDYNIPILSTKNELESAELIRALAIREQSEEKRLPQIRGEKGAMTMNERQRFVIESLPNISARLARRLLEQFGSIRKIIDADVKELTKIKGIGKKTAEDIKKVVDKEYRK